MVSHLSQKISMVSYKYPSVPQIFFFYIYIYFFYEQYRGKGRGYTIYTTLYMEQNQSDQDPNGIRST
jgi:hypothetical protein